MIKATCDLTFSGDWSGKCKWIDYGYLVPDRHQSGGRVCFIAYMKPCGRCCRAVFSVGVAGRSSMRRCRYAGSCFATGWFGLVCLSAVHPSLIQRVATIAERLLLDALRPTAVRAQVGSGRDRAEHVFNCTGRQTDLQGVRVWQVETIGQTRRGTQLEMKKIAPRAI